VFSSKNEFVTDAACANDDNLLSSKITSLHFLQPTDEALEITGYGETERIKIKEKNYNAELLKQKEVQICTLNLAISNLELAEELDTVSF
jgi:hypothetical protein